MRKIIAPYQQRINRFFAVAMLLPATFFFFFFLNTNVHNRIAKTIFSWNKNTATVQAKVHGWGFTAHKARYGSSFSYDYGVEYFFNNHKYFASVTLISRTKDKNGEPYYKPLPQSISLLIDTARPQHYIYENKKETGNVLLTALFLAIMAACVYCLFRPKTSFYFKTPHKGFSAGANNFVLNLLALAPFVFCYFFIKNAHNGTVAQSMDGYEIISSRTPFATEMYSNITTYKNQTTDYISMEMDKKYLTGTDSIEAYWNSNFDDYYKLPVEKMEHSSTIRLLIYKTPKRGNVYIITPKAKYIATPDLYH